MTFDEKFDMFNNLAEKYELKNSVWSMYEVTDIHGVSNVPSGSFLSSYYLSNSYRVAVYGNTWLDLWKAVEEMIKANKDEHGNHVFIEGFNLSKNEFNVYEVSLGS